MSFKGKTVMITGASRGIGAAIGLRLAREGANVAILAKTTEPHPKLPGTIFTVAKEVEEAGGRALPIQCDIRFEDQVAAAVEKTVQKFGGIDVLINNASAIALLNTTDLDVKRYDLMHQINTRGTWLVSKYCIPHLKKSKRNPHIMNISPPLDMKEKWFKDHVAYTMAKFGMSMCVLGMAGELREAGVAVNALWPVSEVETAALQLIKTWRNDGAVAWKTRKPAIMADAAYTILQQDARKYTGNFVMDETVLRKLAGETDFEQYNNVPGTRPEELRPDFFLCDKQMAELQQLRASARAKM